MFYSAIKRSAINITHIFARISIYNFLRRYFQYFWKMYKSMHFLASVIIPIFLSADLQWITGASSWPSEITYLIIAHGLLPRPRTRSSASSHGGLLTPGPLAFFLLGNPYAHPLPIFKMFPWICNSFLYTEGVNNLCAYLIWWEYFLPPLFPFAGGISPISVKKCR